MHHAFSIEDSLRFGWKKTKENSLVLFQVILTLFALNVVSSIVHSSLRNTPQGTLASLILGVVGVVIGTGLLIITLKIARGETAVYRDILPPAKLVWDVFLASLLTGILIFAGLILLIIPGLYFIVRFAFVRYAVIDGASVMESFEKSSKLTEGHKWPLLGFIALVVILNIIGAMLLLVGLLITIPVTLIAMAHIYLKLKAHAQKGHEHHDHAGHSHE